MNFLTKLIPVAVLLVSQLQSSANAQPVELEERSKFMSLNPAPNGWSVTFYEKDGCLGGKLDSEAHINPQGCQNVATNGAPSAAGRIGNGKDNELVITLYDEKNCKGYSHPIVMTQDMCIHKIDTNWMSYEVIRLHY